MIYNSDNSYNLTRNYLIELIDVVIVINNYKIIIKK